MSKVHGDFGDLSRYDVELGAPADVMLVCQDCDRSIARWQLETVPLDELTRAAAEHETAEEIEPPTFGDDAVPVDKLDDDGR